MLEIERMDPSGWERVRDVRLRALLDTPDAFGRLHSEEVDRKPAMWQDRLANQGAATYLAAVDGQDGGIVSVADYEGRPGTAGIFSMWAAPEIRGSEAASGLIEAAVAWARPREFDRIVLEVGDKNARAIAFYLRHGFRATGTMGALPAPRDHVIEREMEFRF